MESLTAPEETTDSKKKKEVIQGDRITLGKEQSLKLEGWLKQIEEKTSGMVTLSKSEMVNYLLQKKDSELSISELNQIRKDNYDEVKFAYWALVKIKEAKKAGESITLEDLMRVQKGLVKPLKEPSSEISDTKEKKAPKSASRIDPHENMGP